MVFGYSVADVRKFLLALVGFVAFFVAQGIFPEAVENYAQAVVAVVDAGLIFWVSNRDPNEDELLALRAERDRLNRVDPNRLNTGDFDPSRNKRQGGLVVGPTAPSNRPVNTGAEYEDDEPDAPRYP